MQRSCQRESELRPGTAILLVLGLTLFVLAGLEMILHWWDIADPPVFETNPHYGYRMQPNQSASTRGYRFRINQVGLRGNDFLLPKPSAVYRIAFLGDSIIYGGGLVRDEDLFVNRVASSLTKSEGRQVEAINISAPGWGIENMAGYVRTMGLFQADLVLWVVPSADFRRPKTTLFDHLFLTTKPRSRLLYTFPVALRKLSRWLTQGAHIPGGLSRDSKPLRRNLQVFHDTLAQISQKGTPVAVVFVPSEHGYESLDDFTEFRSAALSRSVVCLDTAAIIQRHGSEELFLDWAHPSPRGHELIAQAVTEFLRENFFRRQGAPSTAKPPTVTATNPKHKSSQERPPAPGAIRSKETLRSP